jgi:hypothetical protein
VNVKGYGFNGTASCSIPNDNNFFPSRFYESPLQVAEVFHRLYMSNLFLYPVSLLSYLLLEHNF